MSASEQDRIIELPELRDRAGVFHDRADAGRVLADMLAPLAGEGAILLAVPAGGVPVAAVIAHRLDLPLDLAVVSKITPSWNSEVGYGAVAWDGTVQLNQDVLPAMGVSEGEIREDTARTVDKVRRRAAALRGDSPMPDLAGRAAILVDDGLASGFTMRVAVQAVRSAGGQRIIVAVPTAHDHAARRLAREADAVYCANVRAGWRFAVAEAYRHWRDLSEAEIARILTDFRSQR